ncbi:MAG: N-acetylglucosamine kinase, partial [Pseudorhodobacter sp.]
GRALTFETHAVVVGTAIANSRKPAWFCTGFIEGTTRLDHYLGMDVGGTATRWVVLDSNGCLLGRGVADGATGLIYDTASLTTFTRALTMVGNALPGQISFAHLGITGVGFSRHRQVENAMQETFGLTPAQYSYSNDMILGWHAAFPKGHGHLVSAGTGSIGVSIGEDEKVTIVGGRGILVDDGGSGAWIALRALDQVYRLIDEHGTALGAEVLAASIFKAMGGDDRDTARAYIYGRDRGQIGMLAVAVASAARKGDTLAAGILEQAGRELARLGTALIRRCGTAPLAFIGGVLALDPSIRSVIEHELTRNNLAFPRIDAALHAAEMARAKGQGIK